MKRAVRACLLLALAAACGCSGSTNDDGAVTDGDGAALTAGWTVLGNGVAYKNTGAGDAVFIGYAGYSVTLDRSAAWVDALFAARLETLHVGHLYAVRGPSDPGYNNKDIANTKLDTHLIGGPAPDAPFVMVAAHSSGSYVASEMFGQVFEGSHDPAHALAHKVVYADLDGGGLDAHLIASLKKVAFVWAQDTTLSQGRSANAGGMEALGAEHGNLGVRLVADHSGCHSGAKWCLHDLLITTRPHDPSTFDLVRDYTDFVGRPVQSAWIRSLEPFLQ